MPNEAAPAPPRLRRAMVRGALTSCAAALAMAAMPWPAHASPKRVLVVTVATEYRHSSIETAERTLAEIGRSSGRFDVELATVGPPQRPAAGAPEAQQAERRAYLETIRAVLAEKMHPRALKRYDAIVFASTTGDLPLPDRDAFVQWVKDGGAFIGIHSASDTLHGHRPYVEMLGGEFDHHREPALFKGINVDPTHPATRHLGAAWDLQGRKEEIYLFRNYLREAVQELIVLNRHPNTGEPGHFPVSWCRTFGKGRVFYTALGHHEYVWDMPDFRQHVLGGITWALGPVADEQAAIRPPEGGDRR